MILPAAWFVSGWLYIALTSVLIILFIPIEKIFTDGSQVGEIVGGAATCTLYFLSAFAASCTAYAIAPWHKLKASCAAQATICICSGTMIWLGYKNPGGYIDSGDFIQQAWWILCTQVAALCLTPTLLNPSRFSRIVLRAFPADTSMQALTCVTVQIMFCCVGFSSAIIDFAPSARKLFTPVVMLLLLAVPTLFVCFRSKMSPRLKRVSFKTCLASIVPLAWISICLPSILSYHEPTAEEQRQNAAREKEFEEHLHKQIYDGDPKAVATERTLSAISRYQTKFSSSKTVVRILEIGRLGGTIGEKPARRRVRAILAQVTDPTELIEIAKDLHTVAESEAGFDRDRVLWQLSWDALWECSRRAAEFPGPPGAMVLATIRSDVAGSEQANNRAFDNFECRQKGQKPKWPEYVDMSEDPRE